ncbi:MAG: hypothetical protein AB7F86_09575 [Bdellovibrionales bacterium]
MSLVRFALLFSFFGFEVRAAEVCTPSPESLARLQVQLARQVRKAEFARDLIGKNPKAVGSVTLSAQSDVDQIARLYGVSPAEARHLLQSKEIKPMMAGGESQIFFNPRTPDRVVKVIRPERIGGITNGTNELVALSYLTRQNARVGANLRVVRIHEVGSNYIVREFVEQAVPLRQVARSPEVAAKIRALHTALIADPNPLYGNLREALIRNPPSMNLMWDPVRKKILLVDAPGF